MRQLMSIDLRDYRTDGKRTTRDSVRSIIIQDKRIAMIYSRKYDYYKVPGGGIELGESHYDAVIRETLEETGLIILKKSIRPYGVINLKAKGSREDLFVQDNYCYFCQVDTMIEQTRQEEYEKEEDFEILWVAPQIAIMANILANHNGKESNLSRAMMLRESMLLELLLVEGHFD